MLSDVYSPTIENSDDATLQYIVTDGRSFTALQQRDMTYTVSSPDPSGMVCQVTSTDAAHGFKLVTDYLTDPARDSVVMRTRLLPLRGDATSVAGLKVYARWDATIDNTGGGGAKNTGANDATIDSATTALVSSDTQPPSGPFAAQVTGAVLASPPFLAATSGFAGTPSDGLVQLDTSHRLVSQYRTATDGNVTQTAEVDTAPGQPFTLALGFGADAATAIKVARASSVSPLGSMLGSYLSGWRAYDRTLRPPPASAGAPASQAAVRRARAMYWLSANVIKADEDKTYPGAFVASPTDPWGQSVPATTTHPGWTYREVFARDGYETFTGLLADGDRASARAMVRFLFDRAQQPDGSFPRDSLLDGTVAPDTFGLSEIDEDAYPLLMAWQGGFAGDAAFYRSHIRPAADFVVSHGPAFGVERWEEHPGYSPSTIAAEIAGLVAAAQLARAAGDPGRAALYLATADAYQRNVKKWTVTSTGPYGTGRYFIRLAVTGHPDTAQTYDLGNGSLAQVDQRRVIDAGFLELTRLGELPASRSRRAPLPGSDRLRHRVANRVRAGVASVRDQGQRRHRRVRRLLRAGSDGLLAVRRPVVPHRQGLRAPVAGARRRAGRARPADGVFRRGSLPAADDAEHDLRDRDGARASLGGSGRGHLAVRLGPGHGVHRVRERQAGRVGFAADLGPGPVPAAGHRPRERAAGRPARHRRGPLRQARAARRAACLGDDGGLRKPGRGHRHGPRREHRGDRGGPAEDVR